MPQQSTEPVQGVLRYALKSEYNLRWLAAWFDSGASSAIHGDDKETLQHPRGFSSLAYYQWIRIVL